MNTPPSDPPPPATNPHTSKTTPTTTTTTDPEQDEIRARLEAFRKAKEAKHRAVQNAQKSVKYPAPFLVPKPEPVPPKPLSTHGFYDPEKQKKPSAVRPWRSTTTVGTGAVKNPLLTKRSPPTAPTLKPRETKPPVKRRSQVSTESGREGTSYTVKRSVAEPSREGTSHTVKKSMPEPSREGTSHTVKKSMPEPSREGTSYTVKKNMPEPSREGTSYTVKKSVAEQTKRNGIQNAGTRPRERTGCTGTFASKSTQTTPLVIAGQGERERKDLDVRRDFRSAKSWKLRVINPKTGFTVSEEHIPATYLSMFTLKDALNAAKRNDRDVARAIFEILYTEERRLTVESCRPIPVQRASYWTAWAQFEEEEGNYGKALSLIEEAIRRQKEPDELLLNTLINYVQRYEKSGNREPLQQIISIGNPTASQSRMFHYREPLEQIQNNPIGSVTTLENSMLPSRSTTSSPEPPFEVLEDPDSPMPSVPDFQSSIALELACWSPTTKNESAKSPLLFHRENSTTVPRDQDDGLVDSDESFMETPVLATPQSGLESDFASFDSGTISPVSRLEEEEQSKTTDITSILDGLDINDRRDETTARWKKSNVARSGKPKTLRFAMDSEDSCVTVLTPLRPTKKEKDLLGLTSVITPVRRSARHLPKDTQVLEEDEVFEDKEYSDVPNKSFKPTSRVSGTPRFQSKLSAKENMSNFEDVDATPNARKIAMQRRIGTVLKKSQEGISDSEQAVAEETGLLYKYGEVTPSKRVKSFLGCDVTLSAVRRSARNLNRIGNGVLTDSGNQRFGNSFTPIVVDSLDELPTDIEYGYVPNPNLPNQEK